MQQQEGMQSVSSLLRAERKTNVRSFQGRTFSIWRLNDLRDLNQSVSLFLFGDVHKEHWKTDQGTVIGLLNANPMKPKEGSDEVGELFTCPSAVENKQNKKN